MGEARYNLMFSGKVASGHELKDVKKALEAILKTSPENVEKLFQNSEVILKKNLDHHTAVRLKALFDETGGICHLEELKGSSLCQDTDFPTKNKPVSTHTCPNCLKEQPLSESCVYCGIIFSKSHKQVRSDSSMPDSIDTSEEGYPSVLGIIKDEPAAGRRSRMITKALIFIVVQIVLLYWFSDDIGYYYRAFSPQQLPSSKYWAKAYSFSDQQSNAIDITDVEPLRAGGFIAAGTAQISGEGGTNGILFKLDQFGRIIWQIYFKSDVGTDALQGVTETKDGNLVAVGYTAGDAWIIKLNQDSQILWQKTYVSGCATGVVPLPDGGVIVTGTASRYEPEPSIWVAKVTTGGKPEWQKTYGGGTGLSIATTSDGGSVVCGYEKYTGHQRLLKLDSLGDIQWQRSFQAWGPGGSIRQLFDGGYVVTGKILSYPRTSTPNFVDPHLPVPSPHFSGLLKLNGSGAVEWWKSYGGEAFSDATETYDGRILAVGATAKHGAGGHDVLAIKIDGTGALQWQKTYGTPGNDGSLVVRALTDGILISGWTSLSQLGAERCLIVKANQEGNFSETGSYPFIGTSELETNDEPAPTGEPPKGESCRVISPTTKVVDKKTAKSLVVANGVLPPEPRLALRGTAEKGARIRNIVISNSGYSILKIKRIKIKGRGVTAMNPIRERTELKPGESFLVDLIVAERASQGSELVIYSNDPLSSITRVPLSRK
jgi:hypothetical protein